MEEEGTKGGTGRGGEGKKGNLEFYDINGSYLAFLLDDKFVI
jgi:hypothetical protein